MKQIYNTTRMLSLQTLDNIFKIIRKNTVYRYIKQLEFICHMYRKKQHYDIPENDEIHDYPTRAKQGAFHLDKLFLQKILTILRKCTH